MLALFAVAALLTAPVAAATPCKAQGMIQTATPADPALLYRREGVRLARRLADLPKPDQEKTVLRTREGCSAPLYVGFAVGR